MIAYQAPMLPQVDYQKMENHFQDHFPFSLVDLEYRTMQDYCYFLEILKSALIEEHLMQAPELLLAHLCAYLGTAVTVHTVHQAEKLESSIVDLIQHQAHAAYQHFNLYPINSTIKNNEQKKNNLETLRQSAPGSIIIQTLRIGRVMINILEKLKDHRQNHFKNFNLPKQTELFCPQEKLIKILLLVSSRKCAEWRKHLDHLSDHYVINQMAIQTGWLIGYFSHLDHQSPDETQYLEYGLPILKLHREHVYQLMHTYTSAVQEKVKLQKEAVADSLLSEIRALSEKTHAQIPPVFNDFQKQIMITQAAVEKTVIELITQGHSVKIILMSLFYFWFTLEVPLINTTDPESMEGEDPFLHMGTIIALVKNTAQSLPPPQLTPEIKTLNEKMQLLKSCLPSPEMLDQAVPKDIKQQTLRINTAIHSVTSEFIQQNIHPEAITIALFSHWMRLSVFFGVSESDWQKMDYYFSDILKAVRNYLSSIMH